MCHHIISLMEKLPTILRSQYKQDLRKDFNLCISLFVDFIAYNFYFIFYSFKIGGFIMPSNVYFLFYESLV
jgi:hypothetical protein